MAKLKGNRLQILRLLGEHGEKHAQQLLELDPSLPSGGLHKLLRRMEENGWLTSRSEQVEGERNRPRRFYALTPFGLNALQYANEQHATADPLWMDFHDVESNITKSQSVVTSFDDMFKELDQIRARQQERTRAFEEDHARSEYLLSQIGAMLEQERARYSDALSEVTPKTKKRLKAVSDASSDVKHVIIRIGSRDFSFATDDDDQELLVDVLREQRAGTHEDLIQEMVDERRGQTPARDSDDEHVNPPEHTPHDDVNKTGRPN